MDGVHPRWARVGLPTMAGLSDRSGKRERSETPALVVHEPLKRLVDSAVFLEVSDRGAVEVWDGPAGSLNRRFASTADPCAP